MKKKILLLRRIEIYSLEWLKTKPNPKGDKKPTENSIPNGDTSNDFTLRAASRLGCSAITTSIHHCTGCPSQQSKTRKINKRYKDHRERHWIVIADYGVYIENIKESTNKN